MELIKKILIFTLLLLPKNEYCVSVNEYVKGGGLFIAALPFTAVSWHYRKQADVYEKKAILNANEAARLRGQHRQYRNALDHDTLRKIHEAAKENEKLVKINQLKTVKMAMRSRTAIFYFLPIAALIVCMSQDNNHEKKKIPTKTL